MTKLTGRESVGNQVRKHYDRRTTPLQRVLDSGLADRAKIPELVALYTTASPLTLKRHIHRN